MEAGSSDRRNSSPGRRPRAGPPVGHAARRSFRGVAGAARSELVLLLAGQANYRFRFRRAPGKFRLLIVQITTTGKEQERVNEIIDSLRSYQLLMNHQIWVVSEPGPENWYPLADRVIVVPARFTARSERKAPHWSSRGASASARASTRPT